MLENLKRLRDTAEKHRVRLLIEPLNSMEGNILNTMAENLTRIGHIHLSGVPDRHEPSQGELDMHRLVQSLEAQGYDGYIGMEYWPVNHTLEGLQNE